MNFAISAPAIGTPNPPVAYLIKWDVGIALFSLDRVSSHVNAPPQATD
jgi:hypothetical protein